MREKVSLVNVVSCQQVWYYSSSALRLATNLPSLVLEYPHTSIALYQLPYHTWSLVLFISHRNYFFVNFKDSPPHFYDARTLSFIKELDAKPAVFVTVVSVVAASLLCSDGGCGLIVHLLSLQEWANSVAFPSIAKARSQPSVPTPNPIDAESGLNEASLRTQENRISTNVSPST